jgi:hypothetical protein
MGDWVYTNENWGSDVGILLQRSLRQSRSALVSVVCAAAMLAQQVLDNDVVLKLVNAGLSENIILSIVKKQPGKYSTSAEDVVKLKNAGVSDPIIAAMIEKQLGGAPEPGARVSRDVPPAGATTGALTAVSSTSWKDGPVAQWNEEDAKQLLANSPWVKTVHLDKVRDLSLFERRDGGDWEAGISTGFGLAEMGLLADWREVRALEYAHALASLGMVVVRWESAIPVRAAEAKVGETVLPGGLGEYYAIAVHDLRRPFRWNLANELKGVAFLKRDKKKDAKPSRVVILPKADELATFVYLFPRSIEITKKDRSIRFEAQIGRLFVSVTFSPEDMQLQGERQL